MSGNSVVPTIPEKNITSGDQQKGGILFQFLLVLHKSDPYLDSPFMSYYVTALHYVCT